VAFKARGLLWTPLEQGMRERGVRSVNVVTSISRPPTSVGVVVRDRSPSDKPHLYLPEQPPVAARLAESGVVDHPAGVVEQPAHLDALADRIGTDCSMSKTTR
jgi:hypothetical protein